MKGDQNSELILVVAPVGRDAELIRSNLGAAGLQAVPCDDLMRVCTAIGEGVGAVLMTEEALRADAMGMLQRCLAAQPAWSDVPVILLADALTQAKARVFNELGTRTDVTLIDRPVRIKSLVSAARSALRARRRQYQIRDLMAELQERINERDRFLAVLGHELRNPLGAILLAAQMTDEEGRIDAEHARLIERQSRHLTQLVNDLLDLSRVAAGKIVLKREVIDLREITAQAMSLVEGQAGQRRLTVELVSETPLRIDADAVRVEQIVSNVLTNAVKYTPDGGHIRVTLEAEGGQAVIRVRDDGVGIAPERIGTIFELFAQAENAIGRAQGGMGIGLSLVRNLVQLHGGSIQAASDGLGKGAEFVIRLPLASATEVPAPRPAENKKNRPATAPAPRRIVIVEDNNDVRDLLRLKLKRLGHHVDAAGDGNEGLRVLLDQKPDLALVDLGLPGLDGFEVARGVRERLGEDIVLVAVSGFGQPEDKRRAIAAGFDEHITKPADIQDIESILLRFPPRNTTDRDRV